MTPTEISLFMAALAACTLAYNVFVLPSRADKKDLEKRLTKLELDDATHEARFTGFSQHLERHHDRYTKIEGQLSEVSRMREDMAVIKTKMEGFGESLNEVKTTMRDISTFLHKT
ncbi:MAG TPA: hypothetical protein VF690_21345 [Hymenobacter sp.]|jgi:archaellum component FlaC